MSLNDTSNGIGDTKGVDIPAGVANPTPSSTYGNPKKDNYVEDPPTSGGDQSESTGLGDSDQTIEATKLEPIGTNPGQASTTGATSTSTTGTTGSESILDQVTQAAQDAISNLTGNK